MEWILKIHPQQYQHILTGDKTIEGRIPDPDNDATNYNLMAEDEYIRFKLTDTHKLVDEKYPITFITHYDTIKDMLEYEGLNNVLPNIETINQGVKLYHEFPDYKRNEVKYGIYAIGLGASESID